MIHSAYEKNARKDCARRRNCERKLYDVVDYKGDSRVAGLARVLQSMLLRSLQRNWKMKAPYDSTNHDGGAR